MTHLFEGHRLPKNLLSPMWRCSINSTSECLEWKRSYLSPGWFRNPLLWIRYIYFLLTFLFVRIYWCLLMFHAKCNLWPFLPAYRHWFNKPILSSQTKTDNIQSCKDKEKRKDKASMIMSLMHELCWWNNLCCSTTLLFHNWARDWSCSGENNTFTAFYRCF